ncbi:MAG: dihydropteroate synthase [Bacteroidales bacterium]|nr:dihydropteroate synthase [Bacteroidales bacterium]
MFSLNLRGRLVEFEHPAVMAIINATPDSFYSGGRNATLRDVENALAEGADILDIGAYSTRSGAADVDVENEWTRLREVLTAVRKLNTEIPVSVDTFRAEIARRALAEGADMVNDISGGTMDPNMLDVVAESGVPYVVMHMRGTPETMQSLIDYADEGGVVTAVINRLASSVAQLESMGIKDVIVDPGFGFAKTVDQNYELLKNLPLIASAVKRPLLAGLSRKSMFYKPLGLTPDDVLPATCAANLLALQGGASILRVHDVGAARQVIQVYNQL